MAATNVSTNFDFLRWKFGTHKALQKRLSKFITWNELSAYALGSKEPSDLLLEQIEHELNLPQGWFKRDNTSLAEMSTEAYATISMYCSLPDRERKAVNALLASLSAA